MKRVTFVIIALLIGAVAWRWLREPPAATPQSVTVAAEARSPIAGTSEAIDAGARDGQAKEDTGETPVPPRTRDDDALLRASRDYFEFAQQMFPLAKQGDPSAQFYLSSALTYCESLYDWYFVVYSTTGAVRHRTLDEALQLTAERPVFKPDDVRDIQQRCQKLRKTNPPPFGTSREWLDAAIASGFPQAQSTAALNLALQGIDRGNSEKAQAARGAAREMAFESLRTRDPRVMAQMGEVAANLSTDNAAKARISRWAWPLAACLRETNCDSIAEWMRLFCNIDTACQPFETPVDIIRRQAGNDYDEVERRAREINEKIDAGTLEESDI